LASGNIKQTVAIICFLAAVVLLVGVIRSRQSQTYRSAPRTAERWKRRAEQSKDPRERCKAVREIAASGSPGTDDILIDLLKEKDEYVAATAANALGRRGKPKAVEPLVEQLNHPGRSAKFAAIAALARLGDPRAAPALEREASQNRLFAGDAAAALGRLKDAKTGGIAVAAEDALIGLLKSSSPRVRLGAILGLKQGGTARALPALEELAARPFEGLDRAAITRPVMEGQVAKPEWIAKPCRQAIGVIRERMAKAGGAS
jgi:HEAT repeat protein